MRFIFSSSPPIFFLQTCFDLFSSFLSIFHSCCTIFDIFPFLLIRSHLFFFLFCFHIIFSTINVDQSKYTLCIRQFGKVNLETFTRQKICTLLDFVAMEEIWMRKLRSLLLYVVSLYPASRIKSIKSCPVLLLVGPQCRSVKLQISDLNISYNYVCKQGKLFWLNS